MPNQQRGSLIVWSVLMTAIFSSWVSAGLQRSLMEHRAALLDVRSAQGIHLAEAGLDQTIHNLQTIEAADDIFAAVLPSGTFTIEEPLTVLDVLVYEARIHGTAGNIQRSINAVLRVTPLSLFRFAMFGDEQMTVGGSIRVDSYDSRDGAYDAVTNSGSNGNIGTNATEDGAIDLNGNSFFIDGQLSVGPDVADPASIVNGLNESLISADPPVISSPEFPLPTVQIPEGVVCEDLTLTGSVVWTLPSPGTYCFANLHVKGGATLTSTGPVTIYLTESLNFEGDSTIGVVNDPTQFLILMETGSSVDISGSIEGEAELYAALYGPDANISIAGDSIIYGAVIGNTVSMSGDARLHYDEALADMTKLSNEGEVEILSWREE